MKKTFYCLVLLLLGGGTAVAKDYTLSSPNGKISVTVSDNGGLHIALQALHNTGNNRVIDGQTADQRFFLGWARVWASNIREQYMDLLLNQDVHSLNAVRVNGALPQIDEWYDAFNIKKGKLFIPKKKRVRIW